MLHCQTLPLRVLYVTPRENWPTTTGAKLRDYYFARSLGSAYSLVLVGYAERVEETADQREALAFCERYIRISRPARYTPLKLLRGVLGRYPITAVNYESPALTEAVTSVLQANRFDAIHLDALHLHPLVPVIDRIQPGVPILYDWHNIDSEVMSRFAESSASLPRKLYAGFTAGRIAKLEREVLRVGAGHFVCSERERQILAAIAPQARIAVVENGVDTGAFREIRRNPQPRDLLFVGSMDYYPNIEAVNHFATFVWPSVHQHYPDLRMTIVGSRPTPAVQALAQRPGIKVTGMVPSVVPYYADALAAVVPLQTGGGTRLKILEAMAARVPVISTTLGAEGIPVEPGRHLLIAESPDDWLKQIARVLEQPGLADALTDSAFELVGEHYDWNAIGARLRSLYEEWIFNQSAS
jgi:polysaccharide biosynthesis protein PslH